MSSLGKSGRFYLRCIWCHAFQGLCAEWVQAYWWSTHRWSCWNFLYSWISYRVSRHFRPKGKRWFCILSKGSWAVLFCYLKVAVRIRNLRCSIDALVVRKQQARRSGSVGPRCLILVLGARHLLSAKLSTILHLLPMSQTFGPSHKHLLSTLFRSDFPRCQRLHWSCFPDLPLCIV